MFVSMFKLVPVKVTVKDVAEAEVAGVKEVTTGETALKIIEQSSQEAF